MTKKIILTLFLLISFFGSVNNGYAESQGEMEAKAKAQSAQSVLNSAKQNYNDLKKEQDTISQYDTDEQKQAREERLKASPEAKAVEVAQKKVAETNSDLHSTQCGKGGSKAGNCIDQTSFEINVNDTIGIGFTTGEDYKKAKEAKGTSGVVNFVLGTIIQKLMIALGVLSVLIMTVGGGYIIMYHGQDELLSKGKSIFMSGVIALVVALSSYYLVSGLRFILYN